MGRIRGGGEHPVDWDDPAQVGAREVAGKVRDNRVLSGLFSPIGP